MERVIMQLLLQNSHDSRESSFKICVAAPTGLYNNGTGLACDAIVLDYGVTCT